MSFTYRLDSTGEAIPPWATPAYMPLHVEVADLKDVWNIQQSRYEDMVFTRQNWKFRVVSLKSRPLTHTVSKASATSGKTAPSSHPLSTFLLTLSTRRPTCSVVLFMGRKPVCSSLGNPGSSISRSTLADRIFSKILPTVTIRLIDQ
jgi:hypothetical protein